MEQRARQGMWQGFSDALAQAVEIVVTPLLFAALGYWLDGRFDTRPVLTAVLGALGLIGVAARSFYAYKAAMEREEEGKPWTRSRP